MGEDLKGINKDGEGFLPREDFEGANEDGKGFLNHVDYECSRVNIPPNDEGNICREDDEMMETLQTYIIYRINASPIYINTNHSSYTKSRKKFS